MLLIDKSDASRLFAIRGMARAICLKLGIPRNDSLAFVIGRGTERTNESAAASWLEDTGIQPDVEVFRDACDALERRLGAAFGDF